jgi:excisionase family DNA binding protein
VSKKPGVPQPRIVVVKMTPLVVTAAQAAQLLACTRRRVQQLIRSRELMGFIEGNRYKVTVASIEDYVARRTSEGRLGAPPLKPHQISQEMEENEYRTEDQN